METSQCALGMSLRPWKPLLVFPPLCITSLLTALEGTAVSTVLPSINDYFQVGSQYVWLMNGYFISFTAFQPIYTQLSEIFGRKSLLLTAVFIFALGSGVSGAATTWTMLLMGRIIQGTGGAGMNLLVQLIINDLVPLRARSKYMSLIYAAFMVGTSLGPFLGGALVQHASWRWIFYINLPISFAALLLLYFFLPLPTLQGITRNASWRQIDFIGNFLIMGSVTSMLVGLSYAGEAFSWLSWQVLLPLMLGFCGIVIFFAYEESPICARPILPPRILADNRTTSIGLILTFVQFMMSYWILYFLPVYFQGVLMASPERSGVLLFPSVLFSVSLTIVFGILLTKTGRYKQIHILATFLLSLGLLLFMKLNAESTVAEVVVFQSLAAAGFGMLMSTVLPAIQAGLPEADSAIATAAWGFIRAMGGIWGLAIPSAIFNARFQSLLGQRVADSHVVQMLSEGSAYAFVSRSKVQQLPEAVQNDVIGTYVDSLRIVWLGGAVFAVISLTLSVFEKEITLSGRDREEKPDEGAG